jgi:spermidine synthase
VIGSGGFTLSQLRSINNPNHYKYVDIDPDISDIVVSSGFLKEINGEVLSQDGRAFLRNARMDGKRYPVIVIDAYSSQVSIPPHLSAVEFHYEVLSTLSVNGVAIYNLILDPLLNTQLAQNSLASIQSVFGACAVNVLSYKSSRSNVLVVCSASAAKMSRHAYSDERNDVPFDLFEADSASAHVRYN